jgi:formylmethanofuran dehydrogenase subunit A
MYFVSIFKYQANKSKVPGDIETLVFGIAATFLAIIAIYVAIYFTRQRALSNSESSSCSFVVPLSFSSKSPISSLSQTARDVEFGLLTTTSPSQQVWTIAREPEEGTMHNFEDSDSTPQELIHTASPNQLHQVIGEALEVFSRHLRSHGHSSRHET